MAQIIVRNLDEAVVVARRLNEEGFRVSLDLLGEEVIDHDSAQTATEEYLECLDRIGEDDLDANIRFYSTVFGQAPAVRSFRPCRSSRVRTGLRECRNTSAVRMNSGMETTSNFSMRHSACSSAPPAR